jgi:hypothetical protein
MNASADNSDSIYDQARDRACLRRNVEYIGVSNF